MTTKLGFRGIMALVAALGLAGTALAEGEPAAKPADPCKVLQKKFDEARKDEASATQFRNARQQRMLGGDLCAKGDTEAGVEALEQALKNIGKY